MRELFLAHPMYGPHPSLSLKERVRERGNTLTASLTSASVTWLVVEVMRSVDEPDGVASGAHDYGLSRGAAGEKMHALEIVAVGHAGGREHDVAAGKFVDLEFFLDVGDAHLFRPFDLLVIARRQTALEFAAGAAQRRRRQHALRRAADAEQKIDAGFRLRRGDGRGDVAVGDQADARARLAHFLDERFMPGTGENDIHKVFEPAS